MKAGDSGWNSPPYLENPNPLAARLAWGELARAPYRAMDVARSQIDAAKVTTWIDDPKLGRAGLPT